MKGTIRIDRLEKLLAHMRSDKVIHKEFDFSRYNHGPEQQIEVPGCGTSGCMMGEMPAVDPEFAFTNLGPVLEVGEVFNHSLVFLFRDANGFKPNIREELLKLNWFDEALADHFITVIAEHLAFDEETGLRMRQIYMEDASELEILPTLSGMFYFGMTIDEYAHVFIPSEQRHSFLLPHQPYNRLLGDATLDEVVENAEQFIAWAKANGRVYVG